MGWKSSTGFPLDLRAGFGGRQASRRSPHGTSTPEQRDAQRSRRDRQRRSGSDSTLQAWEPHQLAAPPARLVEKQSQVTLAKPANPGARGRSTWKPRRLVTSLYTGLVIRPPTSGSALSSLTSADTLSAQTPMPSSR